MNLFTIIFKKGVYNIPELKKIDQENKEKMQQINNKLEETLGYTINIDVLSILALNNLLANYDLSEIVEVSQYFGMLRGTDNIDINDEIWNKLIGVETR